MAPLARFLEAPASAADHAVGLARVRADLQGGYRVSKWLKRTALRVGVTERRVEQLKRLGAGPRPRRGAQPRRARAREAPRALDPVGSTVLTHATAELHDIALRAAVSASRTWVMHVLATCGTTLAHMPSPR